VAALAFPPLLRDILAGDNSDFKGEKAGYDDQHTLEVARVSLPPDHTNKKSPLPSSLDRIPELNELSRAERRRVIEVAVNACFIDSIQLEKGVHLFYTPALWDVNPAKLQGFLKKYGESGMTKIVKDVSGQQGFDITGKLGNPLVDDAIRAGVLPSPTVIWFQFS